MPRRTLHHLCKHQLACIHRHLPDNSGKPAVLCLRRSSR
jgi:hypothetical protein